jgi:Tfp pilus assembly protein PilX
MIRTDQPVGESDPMEHRNSNERGSALVTAMGAMVILTVAALSIVTIATTEKVTGFSEYTNARSFYSADAATEAGVNWMRRQKTPPAIVDTSRHVYVANDFTAMENNNRYRFDIGYVRKRHRSGYPVEFKDYEYVVTAVGASAKESQTNLELVATRLYKEGY